MVQVHLGPLSMRGIGVRRYVCGASHRNRGITTVSDSKILTSPNSPPGAWA